MEFGSYENLQFCDIWLNMLETIYKKIEAGTTYTCYTYDGLGNNTLVQYGDGSYIANEYDVNGRVYRSKSHSADGTLEKTSEYEYDINGHITVARLVEAL